MNHIQGLSRDQMLLFPEAVEDYISAENPVRFLEAFVENLNLVELGFRSALVQQTGRPPYHPADLLKRITSSSITTSPIIPPIRTNSTEWL